MSSIGGLKTGAERWPTPRGPPEIDTVGKSHASPDEPFGTASSPLVARLDEGSKGNTAGSRCLLALTSEQGSFEMKVCGGVL